MGGVIAAAAACNTGRRRKKPNKLVFLFTVIALLMGTFIPLGIILLSTSGGNIQPIFPLLFIILLIFGILILVLVIAEPDQYDEAEDDYYRESRPRRDHIRESKSRWVNNWEGKPTESHYWGTEHQKFTKQYCTNCGVQLEAADIFCSSCGRRVN
jgi:fatty acid desaturase